MAASEGQNVLIIGGSRFVGPHLVELLLNRGHNLTVFNRGLLRSEYPTGMRFIKGDRNEKFNLKERFDAVIDMCAYNGMQTDNALQQLHFDFFLHFSTAAVYKKTGLFPLNESSPLGKWPIWGDYNKGKVECEKALSSSGIKYASIRPVYILGAKNYIDRELFIYRRIYNKQPLFLPGDGQAKIQFVFAEEIAEAIALITEKRAADVFNCAGDEIISLVDLAKMMGKIAGKKPTLQFNLFASGKNFDVIKFPFANENMICDNSKIKTLGLKFRSLFSGLKEDYENYYQHLA